MDSRGTEKANDVASADTPEDVAVLYSWANLHGAKYRDFSASRREYRAQLRRRAAEQLREQALLGQAEAEAAAQVAEAAARDATEVARRRWPEESDATVRRSLREAEEAARTAAAERLEAARRAEVAAVAEAAARREEREIAEAHASAQQQAARYSASDTRRRAAGGTYPDPAGVPGKTMDPYTIYSNAHPPSPTMSSPFEREPGPTMQPIEKTPPQASAVPASDREEDNHTASATQIAGVPATERRAATLAQVAPRRPQGYRPDDASGVRQIYRGQDYDAVQVEYMASTPVTYSGNAAENRAAAASGSQQETKLNDERQDGPGAPASSSLNDRQRVTAGQRRTDGLWADSLRPAPAEAVSSGDQEVRSLWSAGVGDRAEPGSAASFNSDGLAGAPAARFPGARLEVTPRAPALPNQPRSVSPFSQPLPVPETRGRRAQDDFDYQQSPSASMPPRPSVAASENETAAAAPPQRTTFPSDPTGPAWLYAPAVAQVPQRSLPSSLPSSMPSPQPPAAQSSVADTLQHSRERVAARWFALKGVFAQPGQEPETMPVRQKETRTPILAVFSLAGGVGKTSLVATVGRALSSMGEKVLLTDTTSHGLLPFYFGASELRQGTVRTFSPPSGSTDAPIYLVSYDVDQKVGNEEAQEQLAEEIINNSRGTHRILLDLTVASSWIVRRMSRMSPTILVPVAPDMNSVISLQTVEKFFSGVNDGDGRALQPYYVLNQFDTSLPLHLDVREVMRRQLGDRLLPFVIRRAPSVSEALAEGMTVVDYAPDAPVAEDYLNLATWLRTIAAPATAGFRNVRWSER